MDEIRSKDWVVSVYLRTPEPNTNYYLKLSPFRTPISEGEVADSALSLVNRGSFVKVIRSTSTDASTDHFVVIPTDSIRSLSFTPYVEENDRQ